MVQQGFITQLFYHFPIFILTFLLLQPPIDAMQSTVIFTHQAENFPLSDKKKGQSSLPHGLFTKTVLIDVGHGGIDGGTKYGTILEKDINLEIGKKLYQQLTARGVTAIMNRTKDYALSDDNRWSATRSRHQKDLAQRRQLSAEVPVSVFVSLHVNWAKNKRMRAPIILHQNEGRSRMLATFIQQSLNPLFSTHKQPILGPTYYLLRRVQQPAVIVETGFITNEQDRTLLTTPQLQTLIAARICDAIILYQSLF